MNSELSIFSLVTGASITVQLVLLSLLLISIISWTMIFKKGRILAKAKKEADLFERRFWSGADLVDLYKALAQRQNAQGMASIFESGFREYAKLHKQPNMINEVVLEGAQRAMRVTLNREVDKVESGLPFLATVGSTSPYVGLFGTVWGIMNSFIALGAVEQATMAMVAPGIAEALIATAMGLFAAIPAVIAYNRFSYSVDRLEGRYDAFMEEFFNLLNRQVHS
jgi:biopolymer transport protein TolQ